MYSSSEGILACGKVPRTVCADYSWKKQPLAERTAGVTTRSASETLFSLAKWRDISFVIC